MILIESVMVVVHLIQKCCYFLFALSYHIGRLIFLVLGEVFSWIKDFIAVVVLVGEEFYRFFMELNSSIEELLIYVRNSTNCGINCLLDVAAIIGRNIVHFFTSTKVHTRLLTTKLGLCILEFITLVKGGLLLIADSFWWLVTLIPRTLWYLLIYVGDLIVFTVNGILRITITTTHILLDDVFRLSIGLALLFLLLKNRYLILQILRQCLLKTLALMRSFVLNIGLWLSRAHSRLRPQRPTTVSHIVSSPIRRSPLPRSSRGSTSIKSNEKISDTQRCVVCRDQPKSVVLLPCKHLCLCEDCADYLVLPTAATDTCPLCRTKVERSMSVYI